MKSIEYLASEYAKSAVDKALFPALVVGKGPTSERISETMNWFAGSIFTMNHAIRLIPPLAMSQHRQVFAAHFIDLEAYIDCANEVEANAQYLVMPERPHVLMTEGKPIAEVMKAVPKLASMENQGRLITYRKVACKVGLAPARTVSCLYFSAEALFNVIGLLGIKRVYSVGIDGGVKYGAQFSDLTPLTNSQKSFDIHIPELYRIAVHHGFIWDRLYQEPKHGT